MTKQQVIQATKNWVWTFIIELNLCPFARKEWMNERIRYSVFMQSKKNQLAQLLIDECDHLDKSPEIATTLVIFPNALKHFNDYNQFLDVADHIIEQGGWRGIYQVASFHPDYQFADTHFDDVENFTNRSPYPMLHLIRESDVEKAIDHHPAPESIPEQNIELMNKLGELKIKQLYKDAVESDKEVYR